MLTPHTPTPPRWRLSIAICTLERVRSQAQSSAPSAHLPGAHHSTQKQQWTSKRLKEYNLSQPARAFRFYNALWWVTKGSIPCGWASQKDCQKASFIKDRKKQSSRLNLKKNIFQVEKKILRHIKWIFVYSQNICIATLRSDFGEELKTSSKQCI